MIMGEHVSRAETIDGQYSRIECSCGSWQSRAFVRASVSESDMAARDFDKHVVDARRAAAAAEGQRCTSLLPADVRRAGTDHSALRCEFPDDPDQHPTHAGQILHKSASYSWLDDAADQAPALIIAEIRKLAKLQQPGILTIPAGMKVEQLPPRRPKISEQLWALADQISPPSKPMDDGYEGYARLMLLGMAAEFSKRGE